MVSQKHFKVLIRKKR